MIFAIIESKSAGMLSPSLTPVSTRMPGPAGRARRTIRPGAGAGARAGVAGRALGVERGLDGVADRARLGAFQLPAVRHVQLQPDQVGAGGDLRDRVLDLQPSVHLEEGEELLAGVVEELDGAGAAVT